MSDNAKLKELAEALKRAIEQAEHKPGEWAGTAQSMGGICCPGVPFQIGKPWAKEEPWASFSYKRDSWLAVAAVNALPRLLGLIAENERLTANVKLNLCDHPAIHQGDVDLLVAFVTGTSQIELAKVHHCTPPNISRKIRRVRDRLGWREGMSVLEIRARAEQLRALASQGAVVTADLMAERDQLKAEIAGLKTGYEAYEQVNAELKAEVEGLRREREGKVLCDLELFETLRDSANTEADEHRQCMATYRPLRQANLDSVVKKCDDLLAAMGKGEQS